MAKNSKTRPYIIRLLIVASLTLAFVLLFFEIVFILQKDESDRAPKTIEILIPMGTADRIAAGNSEPFIADDMVFVLGDVLEVKNNDKVPHQLGPVWVPPGATSKLLMEQANKFTYTCSFEPDQYLGLEVRQATTLATRLTGVSLAAPTMTALVYLYSLLIFPVQPKNASKEVEV